MVGLNFVYNPPRPRAGSNFLATLCEITFPRVFHRWMNHMVLFLVHGRYASRRTYLFSCPNSILPNLLIFYEFPLFFFYHNRPFFSSETCDVVSASKTRKLWSLVVNFDEYLCESDNPVDKFSQARRTRGRNDRLVIHRIFYNPTTERVDR